jgi:Pentapeptide repeats (8 copies)
VSGQIQEPRTVCFGDVRGATDRGGHHSPVPYRMRASYRESVAVLSERVEIIGGPLPSVTRPPRHDDEEPGPSLFRLLVQGVSLEDLTLPGLYVGRSELKALSFRNSDLHLSAFNWSDVVECDFTAADLSGADLRGCLFVRCTFRGANLSRADLRASSFEACVFDGAVMRDARLYRRPRILGLIKAGPDQTGLPLSDEQRRQVEWCVDEPEPGGG